MTSMERGVLNPKTQSFCCYDTNRRSSLTKVFSFCVVVCGILMHFYSDLTYQAYVGSPETMASFIQDVT
jgi:hypothetical protein